MADKPAFKLTDFDQMFKKSDKTEEKQPETAITTVVSKKQETPKLPLSSLRKFRNHPFKAYTGDKLNELVESIKEHGILTPILVRPLDGEPDVYEIIAGHNRINAAKIAGIEVIPCVIRAMDDDTAAILMVESNFQQRQEISPSEKAFAYKIQLEALKRQGKRTDLSGDPTSCQVGTMSQAGAKVALANDDSKRQVHRYIALTNLIPDLLESVDEEKLPFIPAVNISYLRESEQKDLSNILSDKKMKLSLAKSEKLKSESQSRELDRNEILDILEEEKEKNAGAVKTIKVPYAAVSAFFKGKSMTEAEIRDILLEALRLFYSNAHIEDIFDEGECDYGDEQEDDSLDDERG